MFTNGEKKFMRAIRKLPAGGLVGTREEGSEIVAICWRWSEGGKKVMGWFDMEGNSIEPPREQCK